MAADDVVFQPIRISIKNDSQVTRPGITPRNWMARGSLNPALVFGMFLVLITGLLVSFASASSPRQESEEFYYVFHRSELEIKFPNSNYYQLGQPVAYAILDSGEQIWVCPKVNDRYLFDFDIAIKSSRPLKVIEGVLYHPDKNLRELQESRFKYSLKESSNRSEFLAAMENRYRFLVRGNYTGKVWFQHRLEEVLLAQGKKLDSDRPRTRSFRNGLDQSFEMFSGARAIAENIQLDRDLRNTTEGEFTVDVDSIDGITIKEFDWDTVLKPGPTKLDSLARYVPYDQHVIFFKSISGIEQALQEANSLITPSLGVFAAESVDRQVLPTYFKQMAVDLEQLSQQKFLAKVKSLAVTGSDPFSEIGTDVAALIEMKDAKAAKEFADYYMQLIQSSGPISGIENSGSQQTANRSLSAFAFQHDNLFVLSNSQFQLSRIHSVVKGRDRNLAELKEYRFFRQRYRLAEDETAFAFMSDPAIRRWCSPQWRIGQSRRLRALARMQRLQARHMKQALQMKQDDDPVSIRSLGDTQMLGRLSLTRSGIESAKFNTTAFVTPIAEMGIEKVSDQEELAYVRWRESYQRNWSQAFDPIGIQLKIQPKKLEVDLSVIPLILNSSYRFLIEGKNMERMAGDLHPGTLIHLAVAPGLNNFLQPYLKGLELTELFADDDQSFWRDFTDEKEAEKYFRKNINKLPVALVFNFDNEKNMQKALDSTKVFVQSSIVSETEHRHQGKMYKRLDFEEPFITQDKKLSLYVYKVNSSVFFSLSEALIKRAVERRSKPDRPKNIRPWLGENLAVQFDQRFFRALEGLSSEQYEKELRRLSWANLPILNEWKTMFPEQDPFLIQQSYWGEKLICPGGGSYKWDENARTFYSSAFGSPARPRVPMGTPFPLRQLKLVDAGLTFVTDGIRARFVVEKK